MLDFYSKSIDRLSGNAGASNTLQSPNQNDKGTIIMADSAVSISKLFSQTDKKRPPFIRLYEKVKINKETGCWEWQGHTYKNGYGVIKSFGQDVSAHRLSYELSKGKIPDGLCILHSCDNRKCINPSHLSVGTHQENMAQAKERCRFRSGVNHPQYGKKLSKPRQSNVVIVLGKTYPSQNAAENELNLGHGTVRYWLKRKPQNAQIIKKGELCK